MQRFTSLGPFSTLVSRIPRRMHFVPAAMSRRGYAGNKMDSENSGSSSSSASDSNASFINYHEQDLSKKSKSGKYKESDLEKMPTHDLRKMLQDRGIDTHADIDKMDLVNKAMEQL